MKLAAVSGLIALCFATQQPASIDGAMPKSLATPDRIEGLTEAARIVIATDYALHLEPGVHATKVDDGYRLSTYDGRKLQVAHLLLPSPVFARLTPSGWDLGTGRTLAVNSLLVAREQDDTDSNLKSMQENAKKLKSKNPVERQEAREAIRKLLRFLYGSSGPFGGSEAFSRYAIQQLTHISQAGF